MKRVWNITALLSLLAMLAMTSFVHAEKERKEKKEPLLTKMESFIITMENGKEVRKEAEKALPGTLIEYVVTQTNQSSKTLNNIASTGPIPENTTLVPGSAKPTEGFLVSIDGGDKFVAFPAMKTITTDDGKEKKVEAKAADYTTVRWLTDVMEPGETKTFVYRVTVN